MDAITDRGKKIKVLVADDHPPFRQGLCGLLNDENDMQCVGTAADGEEAVRLADKLMPDVVVIDVAMPKLNGVEAAKQIKIACPTAAILMLSAFSYQSYVLASIQVGASGYMLKKSPLPELIQAIRMVYAGDVVFDQEAGSKILCRVAADKGEGKAGFTALQDRELQVLRQAARGIGNKQIAMSLGISNRTVQSHLSSIFRKLEVGSRTEAVVRALKEGWLTIEDLS